MQFVELFLPKNVQNLVYFVVRKLAENVTTAVEDAIGHLWQ